MNNLSEKENFISNCHYVTAKKLLIFLDSVSLESKTTHFS